MQQKSMPLSEIIVRDKRMISLLYEQEIPLICRRISDGKLKKVSFRALYDNNEVFWKQDKGWAFYVSEEHVQAMIDMLKELDGKKEKHYIAEHEAEAKNVEDLLNFGEAYESIASMDSEKRVSLIKQDREKLDTLLIEAPKENEKILEALADTARDAALANRSTILEAIHMGDEAARAYTQGIVDSTRAMVKSSTALIDNTIMQDELITSLVQRSNGTVVQHMTRVFLNGVAFLTYYNRRMLTSSLPNKIRINFDKQYKSYYQRLLPHLHPEDITLERVFHTGMQAISEAQLHTFATGFLIHDIGKAKDIEYHEGEAAYDRDTVVDHVRQGYLAVMHKTNYPREAGLITGYHHEYYGSPDGYGFYRALLANARKNNPKLKQDYCMSFTMEPMIKFNALAYFPAKVMEIVDVFDALTDPNRKYRKPLSSDEALDFMQRQFIDEELKLDPILFDLFRTFTKGKQPAS